MWNFKGHQMTKKKKKKKPPYKRRAKLEVSHLLISNHTVKLQQSKQYSTGMETDIQICLELISRTESRNNLITSMINLGITKGAKTTQWREELPFQQIIQEQLDRQVQNDKVRPLP